MKKSGRLFALLCIFSILISSFFGTAAFAEGEDFEIHNGVLTNYFGAGGSVTIPDGVTKIGAEAFANCDNITSVIIPGTVTAVGEYAFSECHNLTSVTIPESVVSIDCHAFDGTPWFEECPQEFLIAGKNILLKYNGTGSSVTIPSQVETIGNCVFQNRTDINDITIPASVTGIEMQAFSGCTGLDTIILPLCLTHIGADAFSGCTKLASVDIPDSVTNMEADAFSGCSKLAHVHISSGLTKIESSTFSDCTSLSKVEIPQSVTKIGYNAFCGCTALTTVDIPDTVTGFGYGVFYNTPWQNNFPTDFVTVNGILLKYKGKNSVVELPDGITRINDNSFSGNNTITRVKMPEGVRQIGEQAFAACSKLTEVEIPESATHIEGDAFLNTKATIFGYEYTMAQEYAKKYDIPFSPYIVRSSKAYTGSLTFDTKNYQMAPNNCYDVGVTLMGSGRIRNIQVASSRDSIVKVEKLPNGNFRITGLKSGIAYITCTVYDGRTAVSHASIKVCVAPGVKQGGLPGRSTSYFN